VVGGGGVAGLKFVGSPDIALLSCIPLALDPMVITIEVHIVQYEQARGLVS